MNKKICIFGLGYVGLPLAHAFSSKFKVIGYDINTRRIDELNYFEDRTEELTKEQLIEAKNNGMIFTSNLDDVQNCNIYIVTVPTPIKENNQPDLFPLEASSSTISKLLKKDDIVIYESTVYPGATEEVCVPLLEKGSGLIFNKDFFCGYSPERINPGDKEHTVTKILKITSGSNEETADVVDNLYKTIIKAGTYKASSIKVAEAAKVIENTQRDVNIALINELAMIFGNMGINTQEVLNAASTKWNFINLKPGLVGGHCISIDPHYLLYKSKSMGYVPDIIQTSRNLNENMSTYISDKLIKEMAKRKISINNSRVLIMGITFKENCPDIRNTKVIKIVKALESYGIICDIYDPNAYLDEVSSHLGKKLIEFPKENYYDATLVAVAHNSFKEIGLNNIKKFNKENYLIFDIKSMFNIFDDELIVNL